MPWTIVKSILNFKKNKKTYVQWLNGFYKDTKICVYQEKRYRKQKRVLEKFSNVNGVTEGNKKRTKLFSEKE